MVLIGHVLYNVINYTNKNLYNLYMQTQEQALFENIPIHKMDISILFDGIGFYGPIIVIIIGITILWNQKKYMWAYLIGAICNSYFNRYLKSIFLEERPLHPIPFSKYEIYNNVERYGMPSGHASAIGFSIMYLLLVKPNSVWLPICAFIGMLTLYQRWKYRRHTVEQVFIGTIMGSISGWIVYSLVTQWILWL